MAKRAVKLCVKRGGVTYDRVKSAIDSMAHHLQLMKVRAVEDSNGKMAILISGASVSIQKMDGDNQYIEEAEENVKKSCN
jgi:polyhydroxyalkanoate synthesis regulator phasin